MEQNKRLTHVIFTKMALSTSIGLFDQSDWFFLGDGNESRCCFLQMLKKKKKEKKNVVNT